MPCTFKVRPKAVTMGNYDEVASFACTDARNDSRCQKQDSKAAMLENGPHCLFLFTL
jgi:hypothetical protein